MKPTRATQPYRRGARAPSAALNAMLRGRTLTGFNPADVQRAAFLVAAGTRKRTKRAPRSPRPPR